MIDTKICPKCHGDGKCAECNGSEFVECICADCGDIHDNYCEDCEEGECADCRGLGRVRVSDKEREQKGQLNAFAP